MTQELKTMPPKNGERIIHVASIDDEPAWGGHVKEALNGPDSCFEVDEWVSPEAFESEASKSYNILVLDEYYGDRYTRRAGELIEFSKKRYPTAHSIILSHNSPPIDSNDPQFRGIPVLDKNEFQVSRGSKLRTKIRELLPLCVDIDDETRSLAYHVLRKKDCEAGASENDSLEEIKFGDLLYPLRDKFMTRSEWAASDSECIFEFATHSSFMTGKGPDTHIARQAFYAHFHMNFQRLLSTREINRADEDRRLWAVFAEIVNMDEYRPNRTVIVPHLVGEIESVDREGTCDVHWWNCPPSTHRLEEAPCLANMERGNWIEAIVEQRLLAQSIVRVIDASRIEAPIYSQQQRESFWNQPEAKAGA